MASKASTASKASRAATKRHRVSVELPEDVRAALDTKIAAYQTEPWLRPDRHALIVEMIRRGLAASLDATASTASTASRDAKDTPTSRRTRAANSGGYVHHRSRKDMLSEGASLGIPEAALKHYRLLKDGVKPTRQGFLDTEDLIGKVRAAKAARQDPAPLWASFLPSR